MNQATTDQDQIQQLTAQLAECYRLSGADPDGDEDWRLAPRAVEEVRRLRQESDEENERQAAQLAAAKKALRSALPDWVPDESDADGHICNELTNGDVRAMLRALATPSPAARRRLEDKARLDWLDTYRKTICYREVQPFIGPIYETSTYPVREAIDTARSKASTKEGA